MINLKFRWACLAGCLQHPQHVFIRLAASYADRILRGAKPIGQPVQQPTKFELVINRKTAKVIANPARYILAPSAGVPDIRRIGVTAGDAKRRFNGRSGCGPVIG